MSSTNFHFEDFTEKSYRNILASAKKKYSFENFGTTSQNKHVLWRHDVDLSMHRALRLAQIEHEMGVRATYFLWLHSDYYNLFEKSISDKVLGILALGHTIGLHFDASFYHAEDLDFLQQKLIFEKNILENLFNSPVDVFSFHNPTAGNALSFTDTHIAGMFNTYSSAIKDNYFYCSDSNGYWRYHRLPEVVETGIHDRLHILTHPEWWTPEAMSPRERISRCIDGRAQLLHKEYDQNLKKFGRKNIG